MRKYFILFLLLVSALVMRAENASNVRIRQEGKSIIITYDLSKRSVVRVLMSSNNSGYYTELKAVSGNVEQFVSRMNSFVKTLGCTNTNLINPHGLHNDNHYTTAYDMYLIYNEAIKHDIFNELF